MEAVRLEGVERTPRPLTTAAEGPDYLLLVADARLDRPSVSPVDLKPFVGHRVQVIARPPDPPPTPVGTKGSAEPDSRPATETEKVEKLTVTSIEQVFPSCS
jgi:hypothetical protein